MSTDKEIEVILSEGGMSSKAFTHTTPAIRKLINQAVVEELEALKDKAEPFDVSPLTAAVPVSLIESRITELEGEE